MYEDEAASKAFAENEDQFGGSNANTTPIELAIVDASAGRIIASGDAQISSAMLNPDLDNTSLRLDTADYQLAPGIRAFGVDAGSGYTANCGDGTIGPSRSLYVRDGDRIRPGLQGLGLSYSMTMQQGAADRCHVKATGLPDVTEKWTVTIAIARTMSHGWNDLLIRRDFSVNAEPPAAHCQATLHYDGKQYQGAILFDGDTACSRAEDAFVRAIARRFHMTDKSWLTFGQTD